MTGIALVHALRRTVERRLVVCLATGSHVRDLEANEALRLVMLRPTEFRGYGSGRRVKRIERFQPDRTWQKCFRTEGSASLPFRADGPSKMYMGVVNAVR